MMQKHRLGGNVLGASRLPGAHNGRLSVLVRKSRPEVIGFGIKVRVYLLRRLRIE